VSSFTQPHGRFEIMTGCPVFTSDGEQLGDVKEVSGDYFKVDAPMARDYWLSCDRVSSSADDRVVLNLTKDELGGYKLEAPGPAMTTHDGDREMERETRRNHEPGYDPESRGEPIIGGTSDALISEEEQRQQRERMERELAEQRRHLPHD
jgi:hypothetical protein